ncbi:hypothetical protein TRFO_03729 [Tritrichomonas foetus]|uniref:non-specific serine/threonine protein kinase n=1 Tax=Tritrichomonas foetus TaxID=1144522 RepID=A0A1J4KLD4_9EUKA|nr:hypothetical protein TRFO_03729 [Tritrichomonas foetus]|eukprot:OHT12105.1 hypothetical protein TRFO_03729 [Tritrichomonas foetus]
MSVPENPIHVSSKDYTVIKEIGEGSYGRALLARLNETGQMIVVKEISFKRLSEQERESAHKETTILSSLDHPNIIGYRGSFLENQTFHILMDYADGGDLAQQIASRVAEKKEKEKAEKEKSKNIRNSENFDCHFQEEKILNWFVQICLALKHIHDRKILHRDLKTQNIFLTKNGVIKLGDFGISKILDQTTSFAKTSIGTPFYLSPEICEGKPYNRKSDIWALGCVLYELCCLRKPFDSNCINGLIIQIICKKPPPIPSCYSKNLQNLVDLLLKKNQAQRPTISEILNIKFVHDRIGKLLSNTLRQLEFCHTTFHGVRGGETPLNVMARAAVSPNVQERNSKKAGSKMAVRKSRLPTRQKPKSSTTGRPLSQKKPGTTTDNVSDSTLNSDTSKSSTKGSFKFTPSPKKKSATNSPSKSSTMNDKKEDRSFNDDHENDGGSDDDFEDDLFIEDDFISDDEDLKNLAEVAQDLHANPPQNCENDDDDDGNQMNLTNFTFRGKPLDLKEKENRSKRNEEVRKFITSNLGKSKFDSAYKLVVEESALLSEDQVDSALARILVTEKEMDFYPLIQQLVVAENAEDSSLDYF